MIIGRHPSASQIEVVKEKLWASQGNQSLQNQQNELKNHNQLAYSFVSLFKFIELSEAVLTRFTSSWKF